MQIFASQRTRPDAVREPEEQHRLEHVPLQPGEGIDGRVIQSRRPVVIEDLTQVVSTLHLQSTLQWLGLEPEHTTGSLVCLPLLDGERCPGTLTLYLPALHAFTTERLAQCALFAEQAVLTLTSIQQARAAQISKEQQERKQAHFISLITHELRSPLNAINGYLELALSGAGGELNTEQFEFVQRARSGSEQLYSILEDLLLISRADAGHLHLNRDIITLPPVIENAVEELELTAADNGIVIEVQIPRQLPRLYADAVRLQQILRNLLNNALHFTPTGGHVLISATVEEREIEEAGKEETIKTAEIVEGAEKDTKQATGHVVSVADESDSDDERIQKVICLQIRDSGRGIAPEYHQRIFERFYQVKGEEELRAGGQGLGLAIVKMIVELHGGSVEVESQPGLGSTFLCRLPCLFS
ncbi:HAMP domain-containing histidine kinase [Ktedonobacteria bacterium brp13]|nr:HAMP domain-containing histidine kinase [Ktedonobacteria bacterium brp13]